MSTSAVTVHMFVRPATPPDGVGIVMTQVAELWEFGLIGPGCRVWTNAEIPDCMWVLSDKSTFLRVVNVPTAGWIRLRHGSASWGRTYAATTKESRSVFSLEESPITLGDRDFVTIALRNADSTRMKAVFDGRPQPMLDYEATHGQLRAVDLKLGGFTRKAPLGQPRELDAAQAVLRGLDLLAATAPDRYSAIADHLDAFTTTIDSDKFDRLLAAHMRLAQVCDGITEPILGRIAELAILEDSRDDDRVR